MCLHGIRCHDSPAFSMSEYTSQSLWPQYQALGATIGPSTSQQTHAPHPAAQPTMGPPANVPRPDATPAITTWPTQPGLEHGIPCPSTGWTTHPPEGQFGQSTYSHPQVHNGLRFEYHKIRGAYIIQRTRPGQASQLRHELQAISGHTSRTRKRKPSHPNGQAKPSTQRKLELRRSPLLSFISLS